MFFLHPLELGTVTGGPIFCSAKFTEDDKGLP